MFGFLVSKLWATPPVEVKSKRPPAVEETIRWLRDPGKADEWCTGTLWNAEGTRHCAIGKLMAIGTGDKFVVFDPKGNAFLDGLGFVRTPSGWYSVLNELAHTNNSRGRAAAADWLEERFPT